MSWKRFRRMSCCFVVACGVALSGGCSSDDPTLPEATCIEFTPAEAPGAGKVVARAGAESTCDVAVIEWIATDVNDVFAMKGDIVFDPDAVRYGTFDTTGSVLAADGVPLVAFVNEVDAGRLTLGITRSSWPSSATSSRARRARSP